MAYPSRRHHTNQSTVKRSPLIRGILGLSVLLAVYGLEHDAELMMSQQGSDPGFEPPGAAQSSEAYLTRTLDCLQCELARKL